MMMTTRSQFLSVTTLMAAFMSAGCGAPDTRKPEVATAAAQPVVSGRAFKQARILHIEPTREYLDLGPIAVPENRGGQAFGEWLVLEADRLDADAFLIEEGDLAAVYLPSGGMKMSLPISGTDSFGAALFAVGAALLVDSLGSNDNTALSSQKRYYLRALRFASPSTPAMPLPELDMPPKALGELQALATLDAQLRWAHGQVITGQIDRESYETLRTLLANGG